MYSAIGNLATSLNQIAATDPKGLTDVIRGSLGFYGSDYKDLGNFLVQLQNKNLGIDGNVIQAASNQLKKVVTSNQATGDFESAQGLSVWIPSYTTSWDRYGDRYKGFLFDKETGWSKWIETLAAKSAQ